MAAVDNARTLQAHQLSSVLQRSQTNQVMQPKTSPVGITIHRHVWIVAGTSCCGKSTVAEKLSRQLGCPKFIEGDDYHTAENKAKMQKGIPLTDEDRAPWLDSLRDLAVKTLQQADIADSRSRNVVVTCSALKQRYRQVFRKAVEQDPSLQVHFIFLTAPADVLVARVKMRKDHFFSGEAMVRSQLETLEMPATLETGTDVIHIDCTDDAESVEARIFEQVRAVLGYDSVDTTNRI